MIINIDDNSIKGLPGQRSSAGVGYIFIPEDYADRTTYVQNCYNTGQLSLIDEFGRIDNIRISKHIIKDLEFPIEYKQLGSCLVWVNIPKYEQPIAIACINKSTEMFDVFENQFTFSKKNDDTTVEIRGSIEDSTLNININSNKVTTPELNIRVQSSANQASINTNVDGNINTIVSDSINTQAFKKIKFKIQDLENNENNTEISYENGVGFIYQDEFKNEIIIDADGKFTIKNENYSLKDLFNDIISEISAITTITALGVQPIMNKVQIEELKNKVSQILK